ncbi:UNVERIFIED_CONTAM: hypothetical protein PYX00_008663 [Menopon gallinae]|uniref:Centrosome-associated zinc finger protein CP190 n=1 Tax=Menopon gallinae TaxID=328185 RepID=A0AAW2HQ99_9NEOP
MGELAKVPNYQVKVDNWSIFFLQRLHHFYRKDHHCDLTLMFSTLNTVKSIKVHKLVLHACTDYFESLEVTNDSELGQCLQLSDEMHPDVVIPIISFMYTGKLEFPASLQSRLYEAASKLRMSILTKLLDAQPKQNVPTSGGSHSDESLSKPVGFQCNASDDQSQDGTPQSMQVMQIMSNVSVASPSKQTDDSVVTLTPITMVPSQKTGVKPENVVYSRTSNFDALKASSNVVFKTKTVRKETGPSMTESTPKAKIVDLSLPPPLPGRKLPIWKRKVPFTGSQIVTENTTDILTPERSETPKPTRFEWDEDLNDPTVLRPVEDAFRALAHDVTTEIQHPIVLDGEFTPTRQKETNSNCNDSKRNSPGSPTSPDSPPFKRSRTDLQDMKEYGKQQQLRNEILCSEENSEDGMDPDDLYGSCDEESQDLSSSSQSTLNSSTPKPILKSLTKPEPSTPASKRVRFSLEGKENNKKPNDFALLAKKPGAVMTKHKIVLPMNVNQIRTGGHHVKIVSEVLKKYPNLTKRDNVKLKVVSKIPAAVPPTVQHAVEGDGTGNKSSSSHVSYIYLMNENPNQVSNIQMVTNEKEREFDVENRTGPWICNSCDPSNPIEFDSYYNYRRHLVEVHGLKIDARICEYCGVRSSKRNHLLYHLYTKHHIDPPAHVSFPKCPECDYIALSDALLIKHKSVHETKELLTCYVCNVVFRSFASMQIHLQSAWHKKKVADAPMSVPMYPCPFCENQFANGKNLKDHIEENHQTQLQYSEDSDQASQSDNSRGVEIQDSSDLDSLNHVASGIVTSLNLVGNEQTVVYYEQQAGQDIGREATVMTGEECKDFIIPGSVEEVEPGSEYQGTEQNDETVSVENDDSNSRTSNVEEVNPTSCSDHDYSEPQSDDGIRQVIPLQQEAENFQGTQIIQQILPDQQLVFTSQPSVMFQSSRINLPQRVLLAPGNMVLSQISHPGQNVILPQVIPQARIILSNQIIQQPANILRDSSGTIVFANPEVQPQDMENVETLGYGGVESAQPEVKDQDSKEGIVVVEEHGGVVMEEGSRGEAVENEEEEEEEETGNEDVERSLGLNELMQEAGKKEDDESSSILNNRQKQKSIVVRGESAKIVDDWDETNENSQNVESRSDGPSRPEFF